MFSCPISFWHSCKRRTFVAAKGRPDGGIGRHEGLKIPWPLRPYGFDSRSGHQNKGGKQLIGLSFLPCLLYRALS